MKAIVCPGIHDSKLTESFVEQLLSQLEKKAASHCQSENILIFPGRDRPVYSPLHVWQFVRDNLDGSDGPREERSPLIFIGFSAGVVGAIGAARQWQRSGGCVAAFFALDGWGVPLYGDFPIYRLSHDYFTHWSSALLGGGIGDSFYAEPEVEHLDLWREPQTVRGWWNRPSGEGLPSQTPTTAVLFLATLIERHRAFFPA